MISAMFCGHQGHSVPGDTSSIQVFLSLRPKTAESLQWGSIPVHNSELFLWVSASMMETRPRRQQTSGTHRTHAKGKDEGSVWVHFSSGMLSRPAAPPCCLHPQPVSHSFVESTIAVTREAEGQQAQSSTGTSTQRGCQDGRELLSAWWGWHWKPPGLTGAGCCCSELRKVENMLIRVLVLDKGGSWDHSEGLGYFSKWHEIKRWWQRLQLCHHSTSFITQFQFCSVK